MCDGVAIFETFSHQNVTVVSSSLSYFFCFDRCHIKLSSQLIQISSENPAKGGFLSGFQVLASYPVSTKVYSQHMTHLYCPDHGIS
jgi:hypothetical protein